MGDITSLCQRVLLIHSGNIFYDGSLTHLTDRLSPRRSVNLKLYEYRSIEAFKSYGEVIKYDGLLVTILIQKRELATKLSLLLQEIPVKDLDIKDAPIEELIGRLINTGTIDV